MATAQAIIVAALSTLRRSSLSYTAQANYIIVQLNDNGYLVTPKPPPPKQLAAKSLSTNPPKTIVKLTIGNKS